MMSRRCWPLPALLAIAGLGSCGVAWSGEPAQGPRKTEKGVDLTWGMKIPLRDGVKLNATLYREWVDVFLGAK